MLEFFRNIFKKLKSAINQERYTQEYGRIINILRRVTPLELSDVEKIHTILQECVSNRALLDRRMETVKEALRNKTLIRKRSLTAQDRLGQISKRRIDNGRDVSYYIDGKIIHGEVRSEEEDLYFSKEHVESLNCVPLKPKKCDFDCVVNECKSCMEKRLRAELSRKMEAEDERLFGERTKKRKKSCNVVTDLNEQFGIPRIFGASVADECFDIEELDSHEREEFIKWRESQKACAMAVRGSLDLKSGYAELEKHPGPSSGIGNTGAAGDPMSMVEEAPKPCIDSSAAHQSSPDNVVEPSNISSDVPSHAAKGSLGDPEICENSLPSAVQNPFALEDTPALSANTESFRNPFCTTVDKSSSSTVPAQNDVQGPVSLGAMANPFALTNPERPDAAITSPSDAKVVPSVPSIPQHQASSLAITNPFSTMEPKTMLKNPFAGPLLTNPFSSTSLASSSSIGKPETLEQADSGTPSFDYRGPGSSGVSTMANPFISSEPPSSFQLPKPSIIPSPFETSTTFPNSNPFKQPPDSSQLTNPFAQGNPFSSKNIFQNSSNQEDPGFFASNDTGAGDGFRRKRAYRKR